MTAVVPTCRHTTELARTPAHRSSLPDRPAIVVDDASVACTATLIRSRFPRVVLVHAPACANSGAAAARMRHVAFCDDDTGRAPGWP